MKLRDAPATFEQMLAAVGLANDSFEPWPAWKVFKAFARVPVVDIFDDVTVQYGPEGDDADARVALFFSREFSEAGDDGADPVCHVGCEFVFPADALARAGDADFWTQDYGSLEQFIDAVESAEGFQRLVNAEPLASSVFRQEA